MQEIINSAKASIAELEFRISRMRGVITGNPWVIECCPGLYLVAEGDGSRGGCITGGVVCYTPERIDAAVQHVRDNSDGVFAGARKVNYGDALRAELVTMHDLLIRAERLAA